jgi:hypothetical protein
VNDVDLAVGDIVCLKQTTSPAAPSARWRIHEIHKPTIEGEKLLVSIRPANKPNDKDYEGWPMHRFHTIEASRLRKAE